MSGSKKLIISMSFLLAGTAIGAGILGLPVALGLAGFIPSLLGMLAAWFILTLAGWIFIIKIFESKEPVLDFADLYKKEFGHWSLWFNSFGYFITFYGIITAYLSGIATTILEIFPFLRGIPFASKILIVIFFIILTLLVLFGIRIFRRFNSLFTICLLVVFLIMVVLCFRHVSVINLEHIDLDILPFTLPILFTSFCFHPVLPLICWYVKEEKKGKRELCWILFWGTMIILVLILIWTFLVLGIVPYSGHGPSIVMANKLNLPSTVPLAKKIKINLISGLALLFTFFAILTSYIGAGAGFMNYVKNFSGIYLKRRNRFTDIVFTFGLPFLVALIYPNLFIRMLGIVGGIGVIIIYGFMPAFLALKKKNKLLMRILGALILLVSIYIFILEITIIFKSY